MRDSSSLISGPGRAPVVVVALLAVWALLLPPGAAQAAGLAPTKVDGYDRSAVVVEEGGQVSDDVVVTSRKTAQVRTVEVQRRPEGRNSPRQNPWQVETTGTTDAAGAFTAVLQPPAPGAWEYRLYVPAAADARGAATKPRKVTAAPALPEVPAPTGLTAEPGDGQVQLAWGPVEGAVYRVYRADGQDGPFGEITDAPVEGTSFTAGGLENGRAYWFAVAAQDPDGRLSVVSAAVPGTPQPPPDETAPPAPAGLQATGGDTSATLRWEPVAADDLAGYLVHRADGPAGPYEPVTADPVAAAEYTAEGLPNDVQAWFRVTAIDLAGNESPPSAPAAAVPSTVPLPASVTALISPDGDTTISAGPFSATVPAGSVTEPTAATVTPLPAATDGSPRADVHIHGPWDPAAGGVSVTMPWVHGGNPQAAPLVIHLAGDGLRVSVGTGVQLDPAAGTVSATVGSLSIVLGSYIDCGSAVGFQRWVGCVPGADPDIPDQLRGWSDYYAEWLLEQYAQEEIATRLAKEAAEARRCPAEGEAASPGVFPGGVTCATSSAEDGSATWTFTNEAAYDLFLYEGGAVYRARVADAATSDWTPSGQIGDTYPAVVRQLAGFFDDSLLFPNSTYSITKPRNSGETELRLEPDAFQTMLWASLQEIANVLIGMDRTGTLAQGELALCVQQSQDAMDEQYVKCVERLAANAVSIGIGAVPVFGPLLLLGGSITNVLLSTGLSLDLRPTQVQLRNYDSIDAPADPRTTDSWIAREPANGRSVLVEGGLVYDIPDGGTFNCLARSRVVWDIGALAVLDQQPGDPALCDNTGRAAWDIRPAPDGNVGTNIILRTPDGGAWLINTDGQLQAIPDGGTYLRLAQGNPVIWNVPQSAIDAWEPVLPPVDAAAFSYERPEDATFGIQVVAPTTTGWWLIEDVLSDDTSRYQWVGPDGRKGPSWESSFRAESAVAGPRGEVFLVGYTYGQQPPTKSLFRVAGDGFGQQLDLGLDTRNPWSGNVVMGDDGNLYWNNADATRTMWVNQIDPATMQVTGRLSVTNGNVRVDATAFGLVALEPGGTVWQIPYDQFEARDGERWTSGSEPLQRTSYRQMSVGRDGSVADAQYPGVPYCSTVQVSSRHPDGTQWIKPLADWTADAMSECDFEDIDTRPDGGMVLTLKSRDATSDGSFLLFVSPVGERESLRRIDDAAASLSTLIDDSGLALTSYTLPEPCEDPAATGCSRVMLLGHRGVAEVLRDSWVGPGQTMRPTLGTVGISAIYLGPGQLGTFIHSTDRNPCGSSDSCGSSSGVTSFRTKLLDTDIPSKPPNAWW